MALVLEELNIISWAVQALRITALVLQTPQHLRTSQPVAAGRQQGHIAALAVVLSVDVSLAATACRGRRFEMAAWFRIDASG
jgi:hypothetical protein